MPMLKHLNAFITLLVDTIKQMGRGKIWLILALYLGLGWILLFVHYKAVSPGFYGLVSVWTRLFGEDASTRFFHYPGHFYYLSYFFGWAKLIVGVLLEGLFLGTAALMFRNAFADSPGPLGASFRAQVKVWGHLVAVSVIFNGIITLAGLFLPIAAAPWIEGYARRTAAFEFAFMPLVFTVLLSLFYFAIPVVAIHGQSWRQGILRSLKIFLRRPMTCFFLSGLVLFVPVLLAALADRSDIIISKFRPELVFWLLMAGLFAELLANFFWMGTAARFLIEDE